MIPFRTDLAESPGPSTFEAPGLSHLRRSGSWPRRKISPRSGRAGKARQKLADLADLIPHSMVAEKLGITTVCLRNWVAVGEFPEPHSILKRTWLYRVDLL
jgi:hypothetical protein